MAPAISAVSPLLSGTAFLFLGSGLYKTLLAIRATGEGFSPTVVGVVMGAYYLGFLVRCRYCPRLIHDVGHIRTYAALTAIASAATLAHGLVVDAVIWGLDSRLFFPCPGFGDDSAQRFQVAAAAQQGIADHVGRCAVKLELFC